MQVLHRGARRPVRRAVRALLGLHRRAAAARRRPGPRPGARRPPAPARPPARAGAAQALAGRRRPARAGSSGSPRAGRSRSPTTRPGATSSPRSTGRTRRRPRSCAARWSTCCPGGRGSGTSGRWRWCRCRADRGRAGSAGWPSTWPRSAGCRCSTCCAATGPRPPDEVASGVRVAGLLAGLAVTGEVPGGPVLLVDDVARSDLDADRLRGSAARRRLRAGAAPRRPSPSLTGGLARGRAALHRHRLAGRLHRGR